jgi:anti-sigma B factor antagonist
MQRVEHEDLSGGRSAAPPGEPSNHRSAPSRSSRVASAQVHVEGHPTCESVGRAGIRDPTRPCELVVSSERRAGVLILSLSGELDLAASALLERELASAEAGRPTRVVVDLTGLEFIDSSGLRTLMQANERASENGHQLALRQGPRAVRRLFELTSTAQRFSFDD